MKVNFDDYDVVVLHSMKLAQSIFGTGAKLKDILGAAEWMDRSTINYDALISASHKFFMSNLISFKNNKIYLTKNFKRLNRISKKTNKKVNHPLERIDLILKITANNEYEKTPLPNDFYTKADWEIPHANCL